MLWWPLPDFQGCLWEVPPEGLFGHWQVVGKKQEATRACTPTRTTLAPLSITSCRNGVGPIAPLPQTCRTLGSREGMGLIASCPPPSPGRASFCLLAHQVLAYRFLLPRVEAGLEGGGW